MQMPHAQRIFACTSGALLLLGAACASDPGAVPQIPFTGAGVLANGNAGTTAGSTAGTLATGSSVLPTGGSSGLATGSAGTAGGTAGAAGSWDDDADGGVAGSGGDVIAAGSGGSSGNAGGGSGAGGSAGSAPADAPKPKCKTKASQVVLIGDSYINYTAHTFPADMAREAGETWRMYAVPGTAMGSGGIAGLIPPQLDQALAADDDILVAVMDGGGNDILIPALTWPGGAQCKESTTSPSMKVCQDIVKTAMDAAEKLLMKAADAGIRDTVYFFYPHIPGGALGGANPNVILDYSLPKAKAFCDDAVNKTGGKLRCHFIDFVPIFDGHPEWMADDGVHENALGSAQMAKTIWQTMKDECLGQPASSGCCEP